MPALSLFLVIEFGEARVMGPGVTAVGRSSRGLVAEVGPLIVCPPGRANSARTSSGVCESRFTQREIGQHARAPTHAALPRVVNAEADSPDMDPQLACATFATVIPVLLLAGYFVPGEMDLSDRFTRWLVALVTVACTIAEFVAIDGTATSHAPQWEVTVSQVGAGIAAGGFFVVTGIRLVVAFRRAAEADK